MRRLEAGGGWISAAFRLLTGWPRGNGRGARGSGAVFVQLVEPDQHLARLGAVGGAEDAGDLQLVDDARRPAIPDTEPPLQEGGRAVLVLDARLGRFPEEAVALAAVAAVRTLAPT